MATKKARARKANYGIRLTSLAFGKQRPFDVSNHVNLAAKVAPGLRYKEIPDEVLVGTDLDLSIWSLLASDACIARFFRRPGISNPRRFELQSNQHADSLSNAAERTHIVCINLSGAEHITDDTAALIAESCPDLKHLNLERAKNMTDFGICRIMTCCRKLESLNLNFITTLQSRTLCCIVDSRLPLRSLAIAGCPRFSEFSFLHVFRSCSTLESLDLSFCTNVTDKGLQALGKHCRKLQYLNLRACRQISDTGIVALANSGGVSNLSFLDLTRFDLQYKVNDVSLLALSENCRLLETVILSGCSMITDVGIHWLASGCRALTYLDVAGCNTLTNHSLRAMSENMMQLKHVDIRQCTRISDRGIWYISSNCFDIVSFNAEGLSLLSDASRHVDNAEQQGVAALITRCQTLRHLDLSNCSAIANGTLHCIATSCAQLTSLNLCHCYRVTSSGVNAILTHCIRLTSLNVTRCKQVTDDAFLETSQEQSTHRTKQLIALRLDSTRISDATLNWIGRYLPLLQELDISNCQDVSDKGLLALSDSTKLQRLWLRNAVKITATGLSWLAQKCTKLMLLDVTGCCKIQSFSLQSLALSWRLAVFTNNDHFKGMTPLSRANDWDVIYEYGDRLQAALRIQCMYRGRVARQLARQIREENMLLWMVVRLQSIFRGRQARILSAAKAQKETEAARRIQDTYRRFLSIRKASRLRAMFDQQEKVRAAQRIQMLWRKKQVQERISSRYARRIAFERTRRQRVVRIQRIWRRNMARKRMNVLRSAKIAQEVKELKVVTHVQSVFRRRAARRVAEFRRKEVDREHKRQEWAATLLQQQVRRQRRRREVWMMHAYVLNVKRAACRIQTWWRAQMRIKVAKLLGLKEREQSAARKIQAVWRQRKAYLEITLKRLAKEVQDQKMVKAALILQRNWRGCYGRKQVYERKQRALDKVIQFAKMQSDAATRLQACFRGQRGRERYREAQLNKKKQWKEIVGIENGETFFYNRVTGEVRFRRPQDMLDLLTKPCCDNCDVGTVNDATIECKDCGDSFCDVCFVNVHSGGRRKAHEFRALYDYDGRRVDYNDGEFPSCWSSEIEQDEIYGWSYRRSPCRCPDEVQGVWERYVDLITGREWYYNCETNDNSYVPPKEFLKNLE